MNTDFIIKCNNNDEAKMAMKAIAAIGNIHEFSFQPKNGTTVCTWNDPDSKKLVTSVCTLPCYAYDLVTKKGTHKTFKFSQLSLALIYMTQEKSVEVKLNDEYTAKITKTEVSVGCQKFPTSKLVEMYKAYESLGKS